MQDPGSKISRYVALSLSQAEAQAETATALAEAERSQAAQAQGLSEQLKSEGERRARVFNTAVQAAVSKIQRVRFGLCPVSIVVECKVQAAVSKIQRMRCPAQESIGPVQSMLD